MGFEKPITVAKALDEIQGNRFVLPAIQREFVWNDDQITKLFDSLVRGYPIGCFIFWEIQAENLKKFQFYRFMDRYHQRDHDHNEPIELIGDAPRTAVLDGRPRLTALNIGLKGSYADKLPYYRWNNPQAFPERRLYLNLLAPTQDPETQYDFQMLTEEQAKSASDKFWFLVGDVLCFKDLGECFGYCVKQGLTKDGAEFPYKTLIELWHAVKEKPLINFFLEEDQDLDKVLTMFIRVNKGGTTLSYSDMLLSIATAQWKEKDARQEIYHLVDELNGVGEDSFAFDKDFVLKACLVLSDTVGLEFRIVNFTKANMQKIESQWDSISRSLQLTRALLKSWGYNRDTLVANYAAIPIAYYLLHKGCPANFAVSDHFKNERQVVRRWLSAALLKRSFGGTPDSVLRPIRKLLQNAQDGFPFDSILEELKHTPKSMRFGEAELEGILAYRYGQKYTFTALALLYPWLDYSQHFHLDHIFPQAMFKTKELAKHGIPESEWPRWQTEMDGLANLQLLQGIRNQEKSDKAFEDWLQGQGSEPKEIKQYRDLHLIPDVDLSFSNFLTFIKDRQELMMAQLAEVLGVQRTGGQ